MNPDVYWDDYKTYFSSIFAMKNLTFLVNHLYIILCLHFGYSH
jgi:hypothetical protein